MKGLKEILDDLEQAAKKFNAGLCLMSTDDETSTNQFKYLSEVYDELFLIKRNLTEMRIVDETVVAALPKVSMDNLQHGELYLWAVEPDRDNYRLVRLDEEGDGLFSLQDEMFWHFEDNLAGEVYGPLKITD